MKQVFADAGYWIALLNPRDALHRQALAVTPTGRGSILLMRARGLDAALAHDDHFKQAGFRVLLRG